MKRLPLYLIDKSALARLTLGPVRDRIAPILERGRAATCAIIELEVLFSARSSEDLQQTRQRRHLAYQDIPLNERVFERALDVQAALARQGRHRLPIPDLIIAAAAESARAVVLHYDADFDVIAAVTGQPVEWVVPRGTLS